MTEPRLNPAVANHKEPAVVHVEATEAQPLTSENSAVTEVPPTLAEIKRRLATNDFCAMLRYPNLDSVPLEDLIALVLAQPSPLGSTPEQDAELATFLRASLVRDPNEALDEIRGSQSEAIERLEEAQARDVENAFYPFVLADLKEKAGYSERAVNDEIQIALQAQKFTDPMRDFIRRVYERGLRNPAYALLTTEIIYSLPTSNISNPMKRMIAAMENDPSLADSGQRFGQMLMKEGNERGHSMREYVLWSALEYNVGRSLFKHAWNQTSPDQPLPPEAVEGYTKFLRNRSDPDDDVNSHHTPTSVVRSI